MTKQEHLWHLDTQIELAVELQDNCNSESSYNKLDNIINIANTLKEELLK